MTRVNYINTLVFAATGGNTKGNGGNARANASSGSKAKTAATSTPAHAPAASSVPAIQQLINDYQLKSAQDVASYFVAALVDNQLSDDRRAVLRDALAQAAGNGPTLTLAGGGTLSAAGVRQMLYLLLAMPEYQMN
jgi:hypothetical protein